MQEIKNKSLTKTLLTTFLTVALIANLLGVVVGFIFTWWYTIGLLIGSTVGLIDLALIIHQTDKVVDTYTSTGMIKGTIKYSLIRLLVLLAGILVAARLNDDAILPFVIGILLIKVTIYIVQIKNKGVKQWKK